MSLRMFTAIAKFRTLLADLKAAGEASCRGKGPGAKWRYSGSEGTNS